jgi:transposase
MKRSRMPYPAEFKQEAVRLLKEQLLPRSQVARDLGVNPETLRRWARELVPDTAGTRDTSSAPVVSPAELARLRRENEQLRMERDILKKPSASSRGCPNESEASVRGRPRERVSGDTVVHRLGAGSIWLLRLASALTEPTPGARPAADGPESRLSLPTVAEPLAAHAFMPSFKRRASALRASVWRG